MLPPIVIFRFDWPKSTFRPFKPTFAIIVFAFLFIKETAIYSIFNLSLTAYFSGTPCAISFLTF